MFTYCWRLAHDAEVENNWRHREQTRESEHRPLSSTYIYNELYLG